MLGTIIPWMLIKGDVVDPKVWTDVMTTISESMAAAASTQDDADARHKLELVAKALNEMSPAPATEAQPSAAILALVIDNTKGD